MTIRLLLGLLLALSQLRGIALAQVVDEPKLQKAAEILFNDGGGCTGFVIEIVKGDPHSRILVTAAHCFNKVKYDDREYDEMGFKVYRYEDAAYYTPALEDPSHLEVLTLAKKPPRPKETLTIWVIQDEQNEIDSISCKFIGTDWLFYPKQELRPKYRGKLVCEKPLKDGMSGAPVLNEANEVVGLHVASNEVENSQETAWMAELNRKMIRWRKLDPRLPRGRFFDDRYLGKYPVLFYVDKNHRPHGIVRSGYQGEVKPAEQYRFEHGKLDTQLFQWPETDHMTCSETGDKTECLFFNDERVTRYRYLTDDPGNVYAYDRRNANGILLEKIRSLDVLRRVRLDRRVYRD